MTGVTDSGLARDRGQLSNARPGAARTAAPGPTVGRASTARLAGGVSESLTVTVAWPSRPGLTTQPALTRRPGPQLARRRAS